MILVVIITICFMMLRQNNSRVWHETVSYGEAPLLSLGKVWIHCYYSQIYSYVELLYRTDLFENYLYLIRVLETI